MIRVNLFSEAVPRARSRQPMRLAGAAQAALLVVCLAGSVGWLVYDYVRTESAVTRVQHQLVLERAALVRLNRLRSQVAKFDEQKAAIDRHIRLIGKLESNRDESRQLLASVSNTVNRTPLLWLTGLLRKGQSLTIDGQAGSIDAVAAFIAQLRQSGHFDQIQMKTTKQRPNSPVTTFNFSLSAAYLSQAANATFQQGGE